MVLSRARQKELAALASRHQRRKRRELLLEGPVLIHTVLGLVNDQNPRWRVHYLVVADNARDDRAVADVIALARLTNVEVEVVAPDELRQWADTTTPQGVLAVAAPVADITLGDAVQQAATDDRRRSPVRLLVLDGVQDPGNVGTLIRSAAAFGAGAVVLCKGCAEFSHPRVLRASMGAAFRIPVVNRADRDEFAATLAEAQLPLVMADADGESMRAFAWPERVALALGAEVAGLSDALQQADALAGTVAIPQEPVPQSLNVAMAGSILLSHLYRERG